MALTFRMYSTIRFDRPIERGKYYISPGGYEMVMNGKTVTFDFEDYEGTIDAEDPHFLHVMQKNPDYTTFHDLDNITEEDLKNVEGITEFYVYTGEHDDPEIFPVEVTALTFRIFPRCGDAVDVDVTSCIPYRFEP